MKKTFRSLSTRFVRPILLLIGLSLAKLSVAGESVLDAIRIHPIDQAPAVSFSAKAAPTAGAANDQVDPRLLKLAKWLHAQAANQQRSNPHVAAVPRRDASQHNAVAELQRRAGGAVEVRIRKETGTPSLIKGTVLEPRFSGAAKASSDREELTARSFLRLNRVLLRIANPDEELILKKHEKDELGFHHLRFEQAYKGVVVWPCELIVHINPAGNAYLMNGTYVATPAGVALDPSIKADEAMQRARDKLSEGAAIETTQPELIIYGPLEDRAPRLAWKFDLIVTTDRAWRCVIDGLDGTILATISLVQHQAATGSGLDGTGLSRTLNLWSDGGTFYLVDSSKSMFDATSKPPNDGRGVILIYDGANKAVTDPQFSAGLVKSSSVDSGWDPDAVGAAYGLSQTFDYYQERFGRNSLDGDGGNIRAMVRYGNNVQNAFWFGTTKTMVFGFGFTREIDISGHELTHGVINSVGNGGILEYRNQPGSLNEALADIFGEMVEARYRGGLPDWLKADPLDPANRDKLIQDYANPGSVQQLRGTPNPAKMSQFVRLGADVDNGGVHINSSIINHCFYLLAAGMNGALGLGDAEKIFYQAMTAHLQKQSQFIDMRQACVSSAEELFGKDSTQVRRTAEAFDAVEITDAPSTPAPSPIPTVQGPDSTLALRLDSFSGQYFLVRREAALGDGQSGTALDTGDFLSPRRVSVSGNGSFAVFVTADNDVASINTDGTGLSFGDIPGLVHSVAAAPDGNRYAVVVLDQTTGEPTDEIWIVELDPQNVRKIKLLAPGTEGASLDIVKYADSMYFMSDSQTLIYDALSEIKVQNGQPFGSWTLFALNVSDDSIRILIDLNEELDFGNPSLGHTKNNLLTFEVIDKKTGFATLFASDLQSGKRVEVGKLAVPNAIGIPGYNGDDTAIVYAQADDTVVSGFSLLRQALASDGVSPVGAPTLWLSDADLGITYRRGEFVSSNALPAVQLTNPAPGQNFTAPATIEVDAAVSDPDGQVAKVEFYEGSTKLIEVTSPPYSIIWSEVPAGTYNLTARAIDNVGGAQDSAAVELTVGQAGGTTPALKIGRVGSEIRISWAVSATGFSLQSTDQISTPPTWVDVLAPGNVVGQERVVAIPLAPGQKFYRLKGP